MKWEEKSVEAAAPSWKLSPHALEKVLEFSKIRSGHKLKEESESLDWYHYSWSSSGDIFLFSRDPGLRLIYHRHDSKGVCVSRAGLWYEKQVLDILQKSKMTPGDMLANLKDFHLDSFYCMFISEVLARMTDGLMNVNLEPGDHDNYALNLDEVAMYEAMRFRGKPMFSKACDKYLLGHRIHLEGADPSAVRKELEYATHHNGKLVWPRTSVKLPEFQDLSLTAMADVPTETYVQGRMGSGHYTA